MRTVAFMLVLIASLLSLGGNLSGQENNTDPRDYFAYEGGWVARSDDGSWYEMNEFGWRKHVVGKEAGDKGIGIYKEVARTNEYIELENVTYGGKGRLYNDAFKGPDDGGGWRVYYPGRWAKKFDAK
jgi:hypothetical protein